MSQEFDNNVLNLVKQQGLIPMSIWVVSKNLKKSCLAKKGFIVPWPVEILVAKNMNMFIMFGINLKWKWWKIITTCIWNVTFYY